MRATVSPAFPAVNGLITLIGLAGQVSAPAATVAIERATAAKDADNVRIDIMFCSRKSVTPRWRGHRETLLGCPLCANSGHYGCSYSMISSASAERFGGTSMPSALAVLRLMMNSNLLDCTTGKSAGFSPLRILPA